MKSKINHVFTNILAVCIMTLLFSNVGLAQQNPIYRLSDDVRQVQSRTSSGVVTNYPEELLYDLQASVYIKNNAVLNVHGSASPKVLKVKDVQSLGFLNTHSDLYNKIEMITINLTSARDLSNPFDVDLIRGFSHLKYIYLKCEFPISEAQIRAFIQNADPEVSIFYKNINRS